MTSLRKRVSSYFRQLSFHNEPRGKRQTVNENSFINKYLTGQIKLRDGPPVLHGKTPNDLPNFELGSYLTGAESIIGCSTGPNGGLTTVKRIEKHLSIPDADIDFIDTQDEIVEQIQKSPIPYRHKGPLDQTPMKIKVAGQTYIVSNNFKKNQNRKSRSLGSLQDLTDSQPIKTEESTNLNIVTNNNNEVSTCRNTNHEITTELVCCDVSNKEITKCDGKNSNTDVENSNTNVNNSAEAVTKNFSDTRESLPEDRITQNYALSKSKSAGCALDRNKKGKIIRLSQRPGQQGPNQDNLLATTNSELPQKWDKKTNYVYGLSDSLYDTNQVTKIKNGNPIADCYGIIARNDSAILALADGVNWGEKACIAAKSAIHGSLHYLNKTIFDDTSLFNFELDSKHIENSPINTNFETYDVTTKNDTTLSVTNLVSNTNEVFICLLRAFNSAHNLILENEGMLTTLTVAVVLPLKSSKYRKEQNSASELNENLTEKYICCVCNVGDTFSYVYSTKYGVREITKGSHDINSNRDMRDALGALGPVDGINPELNNLTLSVTTLDPGDIIMIASDGLTDNYDPTVCKFTVNQAAYDTAKHKITNLHPSQHKERHTASRPPAAKPSQVLNTSRSTLISTQNQPNTSSNRITPSNVSRLASKETKIKDCNETKDIKVKDNKKPNVLTTNIHKKITEPTNIKQKDIKKQSTDEIDFTNPLVAQFMLENALDLTKNKQVESHASNIQSEINKKFETGQKSEVSNKSESNRKFETSNKSETSDKSEASYNRTSNNSEITHNRNSSSSEHSNNRNNNDDLKTDSKNRAYRRVVSMVNPKTESILSSDKENKSKNFNPLGKSSSTSRVLKSKTNVNQQSTKIGFLRSKTSLDLNKSPNNHIEIKRNEDGLPLVTPAQKYELTLLLMEDILLRGISGRDKPCVTAKILCENLLRYTISLTAAKRRSLEDKDLYYDNKSDILIEISAREKKIRRKKCLEKILSLPGKLDHVSVVAYNVGNRVFQE